MSVRTQSYGTCEYFVEMEWPYLTVFLNGPLEESVFVTQPSGFVKEEMEEKVYRLNKALYGLKQALMARNRRIDAFLIQSGFKKCSIEYGVYVKKETSVILICLYVDDLLVTGSVKGYWVL